MNKKIIIILMCLILLFVFTGCSAKLPDGIENKVFYKDLDGLLATMVKSFQTKTYKQEVDNILEKMNADKYKENLNDYELSILNAINEVIPDIKNDLNSDNHTIKSDTFNKIEWIYKIFE